MVKTKLFLLLLIISLLAPYASAQTHRASVRGNIFDAADARIAGATVKLVHLQTNETRQIDTNDDGAFILSALPPGEYRIEGEKAGYRKFAQRFTLQVNQEIRIDITLEVGEVTAVEEVTALAPPLKRDSAALGTVIENRAITGLPLDGRNFFELSLLIPGVAPSAQGSAGSARGDLAFNVNGAREDSNNFLLDGVYNLDPKLNTFGVTPSVDAVREFELATSSYDASFGRNPGGQVNVVLNSGSNAWHGTAYEFFRNDALDARNFFAPADQGDPRNQRNQFGFSLGGPVAKNKTFFFGDYEGTRIREGITRITNVPTLAERGGDFSNSIFPAPRNPFTGQPFPGNRIPLQFINPIGRAIAALYPAPNRNVARGNFVSSPIATDREDQFDARVDHSLNSKSQWAARYSFTDRTFFEPFAGAAFASVPGYGNDVFRRGQNAMISETHIFSPSLINEARVAFSRVATRVLHENFGASVNRQVGLPELSTNPRDFGLSFITVTGFSQLGDEFNNPQDGVTNVFQILDHATWSKGNHLVKFGFDFRATQQNAFRDVQSRGFLNFSNQAFTGNALGDLLLGLPTVTGGARLDNHQHIRTESYNFYVNDSYRITPRLTLTAGLRYEYNSPPVDPEDRANLYDATTGSLVRVGTGEVPRSGYEADKNNFAPRVGLAWTIGEGRVLRAGYGIYFDQSALAPGEALFFNPPFFDLNFYFTIPGLYTLTLFDPFPAQFPLALPDSALSIQRDLKTPYMQHWSLGFQQQLGRSRVFEAAYVGSKGTKLIAARDINQPQASPAPVNLRPNPFFADVTGLESRANSVYNSLQLRLEQNLDFGLTMLASYTWSRSIDNASAFFSSAGDPNFPQDSNNVRAERGRSNFDIAHRFSLSYSYELPFGKGRAWLSDRGWITALLTGWQTYGIVTLQTGRPFTVALLQEVDNSNTGRSNLGFGANDRPNVVGNAEISNRTPDRWFDTSAFALPPFGSFGNAGRNILDGPGFQNVNASLVKNTALTENFNLQFRVEAFNLFNHPNFNLPDNFLGSPTFGQILSAQSPRRIQLGLKLLF